jgi:hypothetical protein
MHLADDNAVMIRLRSATVVATLADRPGAVELSVKLDGEATPAVAVAYPGMIGPVSVGDRVLLNTTAVELGLGTGGMHFVVAVQGEPPDGSEPSAGRIMKLRYAPQQVRVMAAEEMDSPHRATLASATGLEGTPVVWTPLHSMVGPATAGARAGGAMTVAYVMTPGAALPASFSRLTAALREKGLLASVISAGQAFGGDIDTVNVFTGLLAARHVVRAEVIVVGDGPGNVGTGTTWGASDIESAMALNAAAILGGRPVAALRISFADRRQRHRVVSHHSITALSRVAMTSTHVAVPSIEDEARRSAVWEALRAAEVDGRHRLVEVTGSPALDLLAQVGIRPESMGRGVEDDPEFFLAAGAAGVLAGRMAVNARSWTSRPRGDGGSS